MTEPTKKLFDPGRTFIIAEIAQSYEGSFDDASALVTAATASTSHTGRGKRGADEFIAGGFRGRSESRGTS